MIRLVRLQTAGGDPLRSRTPTGRKRAAVPATVKVRPGEVRVCGTAAATADLDGVCARRRTDRQVGAKEWFLDRTIRHQNHTLNQYLKPHPPAWAE
jgi:hypothetical protein